MKLLRRLAKRFGYANASELKREITEQLKREYFGASMGRLTSDWMATTSSADSEIRSNNAPLRNRCRDLERNNDYVRRYLKLLENNTLGHCGIGLQMKVREMIRNKSGQFVEQYDRRANQIIETSWRAWTRPFWIQMQRIVLRSVARDGAILIRKTYPKDNPFRFLPRLVEIDQLDTDYNQSNPNVRLGIEYDSLGDVAAYHILKEHPGELFQNARNGRFRERVPADQMLHIFFPERVGQSTGVPWLCSSVFGLKMLGGYIESELVASRAAAAKMGFLVRNGNGTQEYSGETAPDGSKYMETEPGSIEKLPDGFDFKTFDPTHPSTAFQQFVKAQLRGISAGLGVSYVSLANDLESINYSSIRAGLLEEREEWKTIQQWFIDSFVTPIFEEWLRLGLTFGAISDGNFALPAAKFDKFNAPEWKPRRWDWVDPLKDLQASVLAVEKGFKARRSIISEGGDDIENVFQDIAADEALAEENGLDFDKEDSSAQMANEQPETPRKPDTVDA